MTIGEQLLVACLKRKDHKILSIIDKRWLDVDEVKEYTTIMGYYKEHGEVMGVSAFCDKFKLTKDGVDSRPSFYLNSLKERFIFAKISDDVPKILRSLKGDVREGLGKLQTLVSALAVDAIESRDTLYSDDTDVRISDYEEREKSLGVTYLSMGCEALDKVFYGYGRYDLITIGGRAGAGKSWALTFMTTLLERVILDREEETGETLGDILFITNEMGENEIKERIDCIRYRLPYTGFLSGTLTEREKARYFKGLENLKKKKSKIRIVYSCQTIEELATTIGLYQPSAVFIDGSYLMEPKLQEGWEKIVYVTRNLKRIAKNFGVPIINTTQLKRGSSKTGSKFALDGQDEFAYSSSYAQDSDIAIRMYQDADMKFHDLIAMEVVKGRRVVGGTTVVFQNDLDNMCQSITLPAEDEKPEVTEYD